MEVTWLSSNPRPVSLFRFFICKTVVWLINAQGLPELKELSVPPLVLCLQGKVHWLFDHLSDIPEAASLSPSPHGLELKNKAYRKDRKLLNKEDREMHLALRISSICSECDMFISVSNHISRAALVLEPMGKYLTSVSWVQCFGFFFFGSPAHLPGTKKINLY